MSILKTAINNNGDIDKKACRSILYKSVLPLFGVIGVTNPMMRYLSEMLNYTEIKYTGKFHLKRAPATTNGKLIKIYNNFFITEELTEKGVITKETTFQDKLGLLVYQLFCLVYRYNHRLQILGSDPDMEEVGRLAILLKNNTSVLAISDQVEKKIASSIGPKNNISNNTISLPTGLDGTIPTLDDVPDLQVKNNKITIEGLFIHLMKLPSDKRQSLIDKAQESITWDSLEIDENTPMTPAEESVERDKWNKIEAIAASKVVGTEAGDFIKEYGDIHNPRIPYHKLLRQFMISRLNNADKFSWKRPNRRTAIYDSFGYQIVLPTRVPDDTLNTACIYLDTSGSMGIEETTEAISHIANIQQETGCNIHLIYSDVSIQNEHIIPAEESFYDYIVDNDLLPKGGGGTDFRPVQSKMLELQAEHNYDVYVMITDLYGPYLSKDEVEAISNKLLWLLTENADINRPDYGLVLTMNNSQFDN